MEKEPQPESLSTVTIKPEYAASEVYSSEPPPAYHKPQSSAVQVAKIVAVTVVFVSVILGSFLLASAYITANASCRQLEQELELLSEAADRFQPPPQPEALSQEAPLSLKHQSDPLQAEESQRNTKEIENNNIENEPEVNSDSSESFSESSQSSETEEGERTPIHIKLPLQLDFDDLAGALIEKNQKSKMNCIVEKKKAEEVVDHQPKTIRLPFGLNLTTDPRLERLSGERMIIICESGHIQRAQPPPPPQPQQEEDQEDTIMIQPVMIPIPQTPFQTHMPQQMQPVLQQESQAMHTPMSVMHPMEAMRPPMPPMMQAQVQAQSEPQPQQQSDFPPNPILHHIVQQIIAQKIMENEKIREQQQQQQLQQQQMQLQQQQPEPQQLQVQESQPELQQQLQHRFQIPQNMIGQRIPIPEEVLTQLNRLPNRDVIVAVSDPGSEENSQEMRFIQEQRQNAAEINGRQAFARGMPVHIPVSMMPQETEQEQEPQAVASEEPRPHYVQPRSVRSVDALLAKDQKRVKRCACDCAC